VPGLEPASTELPNSSVWPLISNVPGSCIGWSEAKTFAAFFGSTSALYSRPEGCVERMLASTWRGAESGWAAAGMW